MSSTKHSFSLPTLADTAYTYIRDSAFSSLQAPLVRLAEAAVVALMQNIKHGHLRVLTYSRIYTFPAPTDEPSPPQSDPPAYKAELRVVNDIFWLRLLAMGDLGFSEAYMFGDVECDDLVSLFQISLANRDSLMNMNSAISPLFSLGTRLTSSRLVNTIGNSKSNISAHYDISNAMFEAFLSEDMTYSCAIFDDLDADLKRGLHDPTGGEALERFGPHHTHTKPSPEPNAPSLPPCRVFNSELHEAQMRKLKHIIRKSDLRPGHRLLEIGSGWGSLAILAVQMTGCEVDTLTLSHHQYSFARKRIAVLGLCHKIRVHLLDYRSMPDEWKGKFDRVISIEMVEAVGREFLDTYFSIIDWALKPQGGAGVIQAITIPEARQQPFPVIISVFAQHTFSGFERYQREIDFIQKWVIFPGGFLPTVTLLVDALERGSRGTLICDSMVNIGPHYARTLREWRRRFQYNFDRSIAPALVLEHPDVMSGPRGDYELQVFKRKWLYYYCYSEVGFTKRILGDHIITFTREGIEDYNNCPMD